MNKISYKYLENIIPTLEKYVQLFGGKIKPCTEQEVKKLESLIPAPYHLPAAYKEFLFFCGESLRRVYKYRPYMHHSLVVSMIESKNRDALKAIRLYDENAQLYPDILIFTWHDHMYLEFIRLGEGENPPVYYWDEEDELGLEAVKVKSNTFTNFVELLIRTPAKFSLTEKVKQQLEQKQAPRGQQFWIPLPEEKEQGIVYEETMQMVGFLGYKWLDDAASWCGKSSIEYLEELSGWKAVKVGEELRFFPPSYESPEEKKNKLFEQQNKLEEKKQELAKAEKKIANFQKRIKNLSGGKLTGALNQNEALISKIKELEKKLRKEKVVKQNLEKQITELENTRSS